jgi:hypothetical protein
MSPTGGAQKPPEEGARMASRTSTERADRANVARTAAKVAALNGMTSAELADRFQELFGQPTRTRNREYLRKRLAYRIQELAEGGLSPGALDRIDQLGRQAGPRWQAAGRAHGTAVAVSPIPAARDPRLPSEGTVLTRHHGGAEHQVTVLADGFEYRGECYRSLSKIARLVTGTPWNGFQFFLGRAHGTRTRGGTAS